MCTLLFCTVLQKRALSVYVKVTFCKAIQAHTQCNTEIHVQCSKQLYSISKLPLSEYIPNRNMIQGPRHCEDQYLFCLTEEAFTIHIMTVFIEMALIIAYPC